MSQLKPNPFHGEALTSTEALLLKFVLKKCMEGNPSENETASANVINLGETLLVA
jgi:hypothetical protein